MHWAWHAVKVPSGGTRKYRHCVLGFFFIKLSVSRYEEISTAGGARYVNIRQWNLVHGYFPLSGLALKY